MPIVRVALSLTLTANTSSMIRVEKRRNVGACTTSKVLVLLCETGPDCWRKPRRANAPPRSKPEGNIRKCTAGCKSCRQSLLHSWLQKMASQPEQSAQQKSSYRAGACSKDRLVFAAKLAAVAKFNTIHWILAK